MRLHTCQGTEQQNPQTVLLQNITLFLPIMIKHIMTFLDFNIKLFHTYEQNNIVPIIFIQNTWTYLSQVISDKHSFWTIHNRNLSHKCRNHLEGHQALFKVIGVNSREGQVEKRKYMGAALWVPLPGTQHGAWHRHHTVHTGGQTVWFYQVLHGRVHPVNLRQTFIEIKKILSLVISYFYQIKLAVKQFFHTFNWRLPVQVWLYMNFMLKKVL